MESESPPAPDPDPRASDAAPTTGAAAAPEGLGPQRPSPRSLRRMEVLRWALLLLSACAAVGSWYSYARAGSGAAESTRYQCPMHPEIVSDHPGECPICHMDLERVSAERSAAPTGSSSPVTAPASSSTAKPGQYTCPMHPEVVSDEPGRCPKCKMALERVTPSKSHGPAPASVVPVDLALDRVQAIGVRTAQAEERATSTTLRASAIVEAPEQTVAQVHVRAAGFVEGIAVGQTGVRVKAGQLLFSLYSPEIYQAQSELLATQEWPGLGDAQTARDLGARRKLELLGISGKVADRVLAEKKPLRNTAVSAPISGYVARKSVVLGSFVTPEMVLYEIVDLSQVYLVADLYASAAGAVAVGTRGTFRSSTRSAPIEATVDLVYPQMNVQARTTRVRMTLENAELALIPGEYGIVEFGSREGRSVVVPADAVIDTGNEQYVFVETSPGHFAPRTVEIAGEVAGGVELRDGVSGGETVVSGAAFLIDSESRLRASLARATGATSPAPAPSGAAPAGPHHP